MKVTTTKPSDTEIVLTCSADADMLEHTRKEVVSSLGKGVKVPGFRAGTAPASMVEKALDPGTLQNEFLSHAVNHLYSDALKQEDIRPVAQPKVEVTKFVPFSTLECQITVSVMGPVKLGDYKKLTAKKEDSKVDSKDIERVIENMRTQLAEKKDVQREAKDSDQVWINFDGKDAKGQPVNGAKGDNYPLVIGSNTFIPGFEDNVVGLKPGETKEFTVTFPKDYGVKALQSKKVTFTVEVIKVQEVAKPDVDEAFVKKVAPHLKSVEELKEDIKKQLKVESDSKAQRDYENALLTEIIEKSTVTLPEQLIDEQAEVVMRDLRQNIVYRGQTFEEYLENIGMTAEEQREKELIPEAIRRLKAGVILSEIAEKEDITVSSEELDIRLSVLKQRYASDPKMQEELTKPENKQEIGAQLITEKTIAKLVSFNQ